MLSQLPREASPREILPRELLPIIMAHWGGHRLGLTCWDLRRQLSPDAYVSREQVEHDHGSAVTTAMSAAGPIADMVTTSSRLPNGVLHGVTLITKIGWAWGYKTFTEYDRGNCMSRLLWGMNGAVQTHKILVNGWKCEWRPWGNIEKTGGSGCMRVGGEGPYFAMYADFVERATLDATSRQHGGATSLNTK